MSENKTEWLDCGQGTMFICPSGAHMREVTTKAVELKGHGRIFEIYDYSNEPEQNFELIVNAPKVKAQRDLLLELCRYALADLEGVMPEIEPGGAGNHPGWLTIRELKEAIALISL